MQSPEDIAIALRFKEAFDNARLKEGHGMVKRFCERNNISRVQFANTLREYDRRTIPPYWIACLVRDYGVSAGWILTGQKQERAFR